MIVARGLGQSQVLGAISCAGYGIGGAADVIVTPPSPQTGARTKYTLKRPQRLDDDEVVLLLTAFFASGATE